MTRISSLFVASTLAILPISAFAQQAAAPASLATPNSVTTAMPTTDKTIAGKTASDPTVTGPNSMDKTATGAVAGKTTATTTSGINQQVKSSTQNTLHGVNTLTTHHAKAPAPAKAVEPAKS